VTDGGAVEVDHVLWAAADLDEGVRTLRERTGLRASAGGSHPGWGTRNALVGLGDTYLEVLATDPAQDGGWLAEEVLALPGPSLFRWALRTDDMDGVVHRVRAAGLRAEPVAMSRRTPAGDTLRWRIAFVEGHGLGRVVPFVIDWLDTPHPTTTMATQGRLVAVALAHPLANEVRRVLATIGVAVPVDDGPVATVHATVEGPAGTVVLGAGD
jgi:hypothetical protein